MSRRQFSVSLKSLIYTNSSPLFKKKKKKSVFSSAELKRDCHFFMENNASVCKTHPFPYQHSRKRASVYVFVSYLYSPLCLRPLPHQLISDKLYPTPRLSAHSAIHSVCQVSRRTLQKCNYTSPKNYDWLARSIKPLLTSEITETVLNPVGFPESLNLEVKC